MNISEKEPVERTSSRRRGWTHLAVGVSVFLILVALDYSVRFLRSSSPNPDASVRLPLRRLQDFEFVDLDDDEDGEESEMAQDVKDAIKDGMDSGEIGSNHDAVVNVSWVPLEDIEDDDEGSRDIPTNEDDSLDLLWIIIICLGGALMVLLICLAYFCMRQAEREMDADEESNNATKYFNDPNNNGGVTSAGEDEDEGVSEEESDEEAVPEQPQKDTTDNDNLGQFQVSDDIEEEVIDESEEADTDGNQVRFSNQGNAYNPGGYSRGY